MAHRLPYLVEALCHDLDPLRKGESLIREHLTNAGKKKQRQINQLLNKEMKGGHQEEKEMEARTVRKQHRLKRRKSK